MANKKKKYLDNRDKFLRIAPKRMDKALRAIKSVGHLSNLNAYDYNDDEAEKIVLSLSRAVLRNVKRRFDNPDIVESEGFSFDDPEPDSEENEGDYETIEHTDNKS